MISQKFNKKDRKANPSSLDSALKGRNPDSKPFFEHGPIAVPAYDFDFSTFLDQKNIKPVKFGHDNQSFAQFYLHQLAPLRLLRIANCDSDYISCCISTDPENTTAQFNFLICYSAARQILETLNHRDKVTHDNLFQKLCSPVSLPNVWCDFIKCLGNKSSPYGTIDLANPFQAILDFCASAVISLNEMHEDRLKREFLKICRSKYSGDSNLLVTMFNDLRGLPIDKYHIFTSCAQSLEYAKGVAKMLWKEVMKEKIEIVVNKNKCSVNFPDIDTMLQTATPKEIIKNFRELGIDKKKQEELIALIEIATTGTSDSQHPDFCFVQGYIDVDKYLPKILTCCFDICCSSGQSTLKRIYETERFIPAKDGSSAQLVVFDDSTQRYSTKVNLSKYPQALGSILMVTKEVRIVRQKYTSYTDLTQKLAGI
jgi:hypothetical protein